MLQLKVVVWKNLLIRKRHWFLTLIESLLPILLFFLIAYGRSKITGLHKTEVTEATYNEPEPILYSSLSVDETFIYYTPNDEFYQNIIKRTQIKFNMYNNNIRGFVSNNALLQYYATHHNDTVIAIIFHGNNSKALDYTIRYHFGRYGGDLDTTEMYKNKFQFNPGVGTEYYWKGFLSIQKAVDMSFIEKVYDKNLEDNITFAIREFPYPPHKVDSAINTVFITYLPLITIFSFIFLCPAVLKTVVEEKYSGFKELLKMVGMKSWMLWLGWFIYGMIPILFSVTCIVLLMKIPFFGADYPPIEYSGRSILFVFLMLYCMACIVFLFAISSLFSKPTIAVVVGILIWIMSYFVPKYSLGLEESKSKLSWSSSILLNLFPNMALHYGYAAISTYEEREIGIQWYNFHQSSSGGEDDVTMLNVFGMLLVDMLIYMSFTLYMDGVNPGKYGIRKPYYFPIRSLKKFIKGCISSPEVQQTAESVRLDSIEEGHGMKKGIEIHHLSKRYGNTVAVNDLSLDVYQNQITVLIGHNGAGKSTTMSMITGMTDITSGAIRMNGKDIKENIDEIRNSLGLCPQHNLLFADLTVGEHLEFFARLKGRTAEEAAKESQDILKILNIVDKKNVLANTLSGGMKRKLCLGMAVIGGSKILILDEPTSGMDVESRRELWNLLLSWRGEKTILITTHFMEEADVLGDWIAIMANGRLQCYGTPMFLKKKYDTGYHLSLMIKDDINQKDQDKIKNEIEIHMQDAQFKDLNGKNMTFVLPFGGNGKMCKLLSVLEDNKDGLKVENISLTVTTLEDVFLKTKTESEDEKIQIDATSTSSLQALLNIGDPDPKSPTQVVPLIRKKFQFYKKKIFTYIIPIIIAAIFFILTVYLTNSGNNYYGDNGPELKLQLDTYKQTTVFYNGSQNDLVEKMKILYEQLVEGSKSTAIGTKDVEQGILDKGIENIAYYKEHMIVSAEFNVYPNKPEMEVVALYNAIAIHSSPISLNLLTNSIAKALLGNDYSLSVRNWPLETIDTSTAPHEYSEVTVGLLWLIMIPVGCLLIVGSFITFPHIELSTRFFQLQYMCGVKPFTYWLLNFVADLMFYLVVMTVVAILMMVSTPFIGSKEFGVLWVILFMYGITGIPFAYLYSRNHSASGAFALFVILGIFLGIIPTAITGALIESGDDYYVSVGNKLMVIFILFIPHFGLAYSGVLFSRQAIRNYNMQMMPKIKFLSMCSYNPNPCCSGNTAECDYFKSYWPLLSKFGLMFVSCIMYSAINILLDSYCVKKFIGRLKAPRTWLKKIESRDEPDGKPLNNKNSLDAKNLYKSYSGKEIVKNVGFTLSNGECLGILGVNGAGKTTTFRMLTREEVVDQGVVRIAGDNGSIDIDKHEYLGKLGYCPQIDALNFVLTGRQILTVIAQLRGVKDPNAVDTFLRIFELEKYADIPCGHYSGGNKRKLSLAVALIGYPKYILLDEPTNGVDPSSRRKFWNLIKGFQKKKSLSFILTSHSMLECEALCSSLKIMKNGKFERQGTITGLKKDFGGFSVKLKLINKTKSVEENTRATRITDVKAYFNNHYECEIKDEHASQLHVYIKNGKNWSTLFQNMESLRAKYPDLIEDYAISEATLEDVFLSVARSNEIESTPSGAETI